MAVYHDESEGNEADRMRQIGPNTDMEKICIRRTLMDESGIKFWENRECCREGKPLKTRILEEVG